MSSANNRLNNHRRNRSKRFAVLTGYGTREHVECIAVAIQDGGIKSDGKMVDSRIFWGRDYGTPEELVKSVVAWAVQQGAKAIGQIDEVFPIDDRCPPSPRLMNYCA